MVKVYVLAAGLGGAFGLLAPCSPPPYCAEDDPCWDCSTMGNGECGPTFGAPGTTPPVVVEVP